jgi:ubiquinone/menaquinone biosynthesis C-methylase UbiE
MTSGQDQIYVLGHSERELARLERQAAFFAEMTRDALVRAGIGPGMRVLDVGCGVGDVSSVAAELVGPTGKVHGIDISPEAVSIATSRMRADGRDAVRFSVASIESFENYGDFDAVIGRFILVHMTDPAASLRWIAQRLKPGSTLAFVEMDMSTAEAIPPLPLLTTCIERIIEVYRRAGRESDLGSKLFAHFHAAGLVPQMAGFTRIANGSEQAGFDFVAESIRSLIPAMTMLGITNLGDIGIETLRDRLVAEAAAGRHCIFYPRLVGAWAKLGN